LVPLQSGQTDAIFVVAIGIVFFAIVVVLIIYGVRRSTRMSDELSSEWETKLREIKPTATIQKEQQLKAKQQPSPPRDERVRDLTSYNMLQTELRENRTQLQHYVQEIATLQQNEATMRKEIEGLRTEISTLQQRLLTSLDEIQRLRTSIDQSVKMQRVTGPQEIRAQDAQEAQPTVPRPQREGWASRIFRSNSSRRTCPTCGRSLGLNDRYCDWCGSPFPPAT